MQWPKFQLQLHLSYISDYYQEQKKIEAQELKEEAKVFSVIFIFIWFDQLHFCRPRTGSGRQRTMRFSKKDTTAKSWPLYDISCKTSTYERHIWCIKVNELMFECSQILKLLRCWWRLWWKLWWGRIPPLQTRFLSPLCHCHLRLSRNCRNLSHPLLILSPSSSMVSNRKKLPLSSSQISNSCLHCSQIFHHSLPIWCSIDTNRILDFDFDRFLLRVPRQNQQ